MEITAVAGVDKAANKRKFLIIKAADVPGGDPAPPEGGVIKTDKPEERQSIFKRALEGIRKMMGMGDKAMTMDQVLTVQEKESDLWEQEWRMSDAFHSSVRSIMGDESVDKAKKDEMLRETMEQYHTKLMEHMQAMMDLMQQTTAAVEKAKVPPPDMDPKEEMGEDGMPKKNPPVKKGDEVIMTLEELLKGLKAEDRVAVEAEIAKKAAPPAPALPVEVAKRLDDLEKTAGQVTELQKRATEAETKLAKAETDLNAEREVRVSREFLTKASQYPSAGEATAVSAMLRKAYAAGEDVGKAVEESLAKAEARIKANDQITREIGKTGNGPVEGSAEARLDKMAKEQVAKGAAKTYAQAYADVTAANPELYTLSLKEAN